MQSTAFRIHRFPILASTNGLALDWMKSGGARAGDVLVAAEQTSGRGRQGRTWVSRPGALLMTAVLPFQVERVGWTSLAAGIAAARAARDLGAPALVKWPNDVTLDGRKLAGILVEANTPGLAAVGIGLNVTNPLPPAETLLYPAANLAHLPGVTVDQALEALLTRLSECWDLLQAPDLSPLRTAWTELDGTLGRPVRWTRPGEAQDAEGVAEGLDENGALLIRLTDGSRITAAVGEIQFR